MTITSKVRNGGYDWPDWDPPGHDDHLVKARIPDATAVGGILEKTSDTATVTRAIVTVGGVETVAFTANPTNINDHKVSIDAADEAAHGADFLTAKLPVDASMRATDAGTPKTRTLGVIVSPNLSKPNSASGSAGTQTAGTQPSAWDHEHPLGQGPDPTTDGARLYPAAIPSAQSLTAKAIMAALQKWENVDCVLEGPSTCSPVPFAGFAQVTPGVYRRTILGALPDYYTDDVHLTAGMRVVAWADGVATEDLPSLGLYVCDSPGSDAPDGYAQFTRSADANSSAHFVNGKFVNIVSGTRYGAHTLVYSGDTQPSLEHDPITFVDHGTSSIYKTILDGKYGFGTVWTAVSGAVCTWEKHGEGANGDPNIPETSRWLASANLPGDTVQVGERFMVLEDSPYDGLYEIQAVPGVQIGGEQNYQHIMRRVPEANTAATLTDLVALIDGDGDTVFCDGLYFEQTATIVTIDGDATAWDQEVTDPNPPTDRLLTFAQLNQADSGYWTVRKTFTGSATLWTNSLPTLTGTPGITEIPAGRETLQLRPIAVEGWDPVANPGTVTATVKINNGTTGTLIFSSTCPVSLTPSFPAEPIQWQYDLAAAVAMAQGDLLSYNIEVASTCSAPVTVLFAYNDPNLGNWVQLAGVEFPIGGTDDHQALRRRDQDVADAVDPTKADPCHPWNALGPAGRKHVKLGTATLSGSGTTRRLVMPSDSSVAKLVPATSEVIYGIDRTGFSVVGVDTADEIRIHVRATASYTVTFVHGASSTVGEDAMWIDDTEKNMECSSAAVLRFVRDPDSALWRLL